MRTNEEMFKELDEFIESVNCEASELIAILHKAQEIFGYLPMVVQTHIANKINVNVAKVYGVVAMDRNNNRAGAKAIIEGVKHVKNGLSLMIFPEGGIKDRNNEEMVKEDKKDNKGCSNITSISIITYISDLF